MGLAQEGSHVKQLGSLVPTGTGAPQVGNSRLQHTAIYIQKQQIPAMYFTPLSWQNVPISSSSPPPPLFFFPISPVQSILNLSNWGVTSRLHITILTPYFTHYVSVKVNMLWYAQSVLYFRMKCCILKNKFFGTKKQKKINLSFEYSRTLAIKTPQKQALNPSYKF